MDEGTAHPKVRAGLCPTCGHYGEDCTGTESETYTFAVTEQERRIVADALALAAESWTELPDSDEDVENVETARALAERFAAESAQS